MCAENIKNNKQDNRTHDDILMDNIMYRCPNICYILSKAVDLFYDEIQGCRLSEEDLQFFRDYVGHLWQKNENTNTRTALEYLRTTVECLYNAAENRIEYKKTLPIKHYEKEPNVIQVCDGRRGVWVDGDMFFSKDPNLEPLEPIKHL